MARDSHAIDVRVDLAPDLVERLIRRGARLPRGTPWLPTPLRRRVRARHQIEARIAVRVAELDALFADDIGDDLAAL